MRTSIASALALVLVSVASPSAASVHPGATQIEDASFARSLEVEGSTLQLAGAGLFRWKVLFKVYTAAWYVGEGAAPRDVEADVPRRLEVS